MSNFADIHNKQVAPLLTSHEREIGGLQEDVTALYELVEMYFFIFSKAMFNDFFEDQENILEVMEGLQEMQDYYLACVSVVKFLSFMGEQEGPTEDVEVTDDTDDTEEN